MLNLDLDELERLAMAANTGSLTLKEATISYDDHDGVMVGTLNALFICDIEAKSDPRLYPEYLNAMHPGTTLALIDRIRELETKIREQNESGEDAAEFAAKMKAASTGDMEGAHCEMDDLLCAKLRDLGYGEAVDIFEKTDKWYA